MGYLLLRIKPSKTKVIKKFFTNSGHAPMGWGLPAAIGAYFSKKNQTICLTGDGGLTNIQELSTIMHHFFFFPLKIFIFNNKGYLTIKQTQILGFKGRIMGADKKRSFFSRLCKNCKSSFIEIFYFKKSKSIE